MRIYFALLCFACFAAFSGCTTSPDQESLIQLDEQLALDFHEMVSPFKVKMDRQDIVNKLASYHDKYVGSGLSPENSNKRIQVIILDNLNMFKVRDEESIMALKATPCYNAYNVRAQRAEETNFSCVAHAFLDVGELFGCIADLAVELGNAKEEYKDCMCETYNVKC